jgi:hypothetical protein
MQASSGDPGQPSSSPDRAPRRLSATLTGELPCISCGYDLRGLSILGDCPECNTAVRATILAAVDPMADELRPVRRPRLVAVGLVGWIGCWLLGAVVAWSVVLEQLLSSFLGLGPGARVPAERLIAYAPLALPALLLGSGLALVLIARPTDETKRWQSALVLIAAALCVPAGLIAGEITGLPIALPHAGTVLDPDSQQALVLRLALVAIVAVILLCVRPIARTLVRRSLALRTGRVDRQTIAAMIAALGVIAVGDTVRLGAHFASGPAAQTLAVAGLAITLLGSLFFTVGLLSAMIDAVRIARAIVAPAPSLRELTLPRPESSSDTPSTLGAEFLARASAAPTSTLPTSTPPPDDHARRETP